MTTLTINHTTFHNIKFEQNKKLGYYLVNGNAYYSKIHALIEASKANTWPKWVFNESVFAKLDWTKEPDTSLKELYRLRAQQLRDRYDWIRVEASGGGDSTTVIFSFLLNGIHLDEVIFRYPETGEKGVTDNPHDSTSKNTLSEWQYAAQPLLQWIKTNYPKTKVTVHDYAVNMLEEKDRDESWILKTKEYSQPGHSTKHHNYGTPEHLALADSGKQICVLYGVDKPKCCIKDNQWFLYFMDLQANHSNPDVGDYTNITNEYFYWSPDLPELLIKQAHIVKNWFSMPQNAHLRQLAEWPNYQFNERTTYEFVVKSLIYPDYDPATFQVSKPTVNFMNEMDHWFHTNFKGTKLYSIWEAGIKYATNNINDEFLSFDENEPTGFKSFFSPFYYLGDAVKSDRPLHYNARINDNRAITKIVDKKIIIS